MEAKLSSHMHTVLSFHAPSFAFYLMINFIRQAVKGIGSKTRTWGESRKLWSREAEQIVHLEKLFIYLMELYSQDSDKRISQFQF